MYTLGIDIGTTSICAVACREEENEPVWMGSRENCFLPGTWEQDPEEILRKAEELLEEAEAAGFGAEKAGAVGISSQMHGILYVDGEGRAVSLLYTWKDERGKELCRGEKGDLEPLAGAGGIACVPGDSLPGEDFQSYLSRRTGYRMYSGYGTVTHFYLGIRGEIPEGAVKLAGIGDYLAMRLAGRKEPLTDCTMAASFGGFDLEKNRFDLDALGRAGVKTEFYPEVWRNEAAENAAAEGMAAESGNTAVSQTQEAGVVGFYRGTPVLCALGDNQASFFGAADRPEKQISINVGTGSQVSVYSPFLVRTAFPEVRPCFGGGFLYVGASLNGGKVYERLAAFFEETVYAFTGIRVRAYDLLPELAKKGETGLQVRPLLYGARGEREGGSISALTAENFHPQDFIRSYVRGMAEELHQMYEKFPEEIRAGREEIAASGNGIRKNRMLEEEISACFGLPVKIHEVREEAAAGAARAAMRKL